MRDINLLPQELKPNKSVLIFASKVKKASIFAAVFFTLGIIVLVSINYYLTAQYTKSKEEVQRLENEIRLLESTEQRLVLIKDRVDKIVNIASRGSVYEEVGLAKSLIESRPEGVSVGTLYSDKTVLKFSFSTQSLVLIKEYLEKIIAMPDTNGVTLVSFDFNPLVGYTLYLNLAI